MVTTLSIIVHYEFVYTTVTILMLYLCIYACVLSVGPGLIYSVHSVQVGMVQCQCS